MATNKSTSQSSNNVDLIETAEVDEKSAVDEVKLLRKIDIRVMPMLFIIYIAASLDRVNISNALTMSLPAELGMTGQQPNRALTIFFVPYILFEIPSNILMKRLQPHIFLPCCILSFGVIMIGQGFVQSYGGLLATRFLLGLTESGIFPGSFYLMSFWYKHEEAQKRFTAYWSSLILAGAFGGLLATGISNMNGIRGLSNWRWLFILEGILTILIGIAAFFFVSDFPQECQWLSEEERHFVLAKSHTDESQDVTVKLKDLLLFFKEPKHYLGPLMDFSIIVQIYAIAYFTPTIIQTTLGYSVLQTQLHSVPPFAAGFALCVLIAFASDRLGFRLPFILLSQSILIIGLALLLTMSGRGNFSAQYAGMMLIAMGALSAGASIKCLFIMNLQGHQQRAIGTAWLTSVANLGGIVATFSFLKQDAPHYTTGYSILMSMAAVGVVAALGYGGCVWRERRLGGSFDGSKGEKLSY